MKRTFISKFEQLFYDHHSRLNSSSLDAIVFLNSKITYFDEYNLIIEINTAIQDELDNE